MAEVVNYKGFEIHAVPYELAETGHWDINLLIVRHTGNQVRMRNFFAVNTYPAREEAVRHCFRFGRQIIDGQVQNCSIADL